MRFLLTTMIVMSMLAVAPTGGAHHDGEECVFTSHQNAIPILDDHYVIVTPGNPRFQAVMTLWQETNDLPGLQTGWTSCRWGHDSIEPDRLIASIGGQNVISGPIPL